MSIEFKCPICSSEFIVDDKHAGGRGKCRTCGELLRVPTKGNSTFAHTDDELQKTPMTPEEPSTLQTNPPQLPDYSKQISKRDDTCPHCGSLIAPARSLRSDECPKKLQLWQTLTTVFSGLFAFTTILLLFIVCSEGFHGSQRSPSSKLTRQEWINNLLTHYCTV